jgi:hypothetical protein
MLILLKTILTYIHFLGKQLMEKIAEVAIAIAIAIA